MTTLEKIRAELMKEYGNNANAMDWSYRAGLAKALDIINEYAEQKPIEKITLWGGEQFVSIETYQQVCKERDIAIEQLHELGYELGQKIEPCEDTISRKAVSKCHIAYQQY